MSNVPHVREIKRCIFRLLRPKECKPNFALSSLPLAVSVPVHDDTGKLQHSCKDTTMAFLQITFRGNSRKWWRICRRQSRTSGSRWTSTVDLFCFCFFSTKTEATTKVKLICNKIPTFHTFTAFQKYITIPMKMI